MKKHWQTTALGILTILATLAHAGISYLQTGHVDPTVLTGGLATGIAFLRTPDSNKVVEK